MSQTNREGKRVARERLAEERRKQAIKDKRRRQFTVVGAAVLVIALVVGGGVIIQSVRANKHSADYLAAPSGSTSGQSVAVGKASAPVTLTMYQDYRCPVCAQFEGQYGQTIDDLVKAGTLKVNYHLARLIDSKTNGTGSLNSANAALCAQDAGKFGDLNTVLYANQPDESSDPWAQKSAVIDVAKKVPGLDSPAFEGCVNSGKHNADVASMWDYFQKVYKAAGGTSTPTVILGQNELSGTKRGLTRAKILTSPDTFKQEVLAEAAGKGVK